MTAPASKLTRMVTQRSEVPKPLTRAEPPLTRPLRRSDYHALVEAGVFEGERVELLFGGLSPRTSQSRPHNKTATAFQYALHDLLKGRASVQCQMAIVAANESEPEPDVSVYDPADDDSDDHPTHVWLVIEVSESSRLKDKGPKAELYALSGIPEYWMLDLQKREVRVMRDPAPEDREYRSVETLKFGEGHRLSPRRFPDVALDLDALVPRP